MLHQTWNHSWEWFRKGNMNFKRSSHRRVPLFSSTQFHLSPVCKCQCHNGRPRREFAMLWEQVGLISSDKVEFRVHKVILARFSLLFRDMFGGDSSSVPAVSPTSGSHVHVRDIDSAGLKDLTTFMYSIFTNRKVISTSTHDKPWLSSSSSGQQ